MYKFKLVQKGDPRDKKVAKKWYAIPISEKPLAMKTLTRAATENTTTAPIEMEAGLELLAKFIPQQLQQGHTVNIPGVGSFRITFKSEGVEDITTYNAGTMIKNPRVLFTPAKELREAALNGLQFKNGGVQEEGINYATLADYKKAKNIGTGGTTGGGGSDGNEDDNPLG